MKKLSMFFATLVIFSVMLTACQSEAVETDPNTDAAPSTEASIEDSAETEAPASIGAIAPMEGATQLTDSTTEASAAELAELIQLSEGYNWEGWSLPVETTWEEVFAYYDQQAAEAGWTSDAGAIKDVGDNKLAVFGKADGTRLVIIYLPQAEEVQVLALAGK